MKKTLFAIALLNICTISYSSAPAASAGNANVSAPKKESNSSGTSSGFMQAQNLGPRLAALISIQPVGMLGPQSDPSCVFASKQDAVNAGWEFKKQVINPGEIVLNPTSGGAYRYGICTDTQDDQVMVQFGVAAGPMSIMMGNIHPSELIGRFPRKDKK